MEKIYVWRRPGAIGDIIATANLLTNFRRKHPLSKVAYWCEPRMREIVRDFLIAAGFDAVVDCGPDIIPNDGTFMPLVGYPVPWNQTNPGNHPYTPMKKHLIEYFADDLGVAPDFDSLKMRRPTDFPVPRGTYITMQVAAGWSPYKNWDLENWNRLCYRLQKANIHVIQVGAMTDPIIPYAQQISGPVPNLQFDTCLAAIANARIHMGVDSWGNHATNIRWYDDLEDGTPRGYRRTPGVILWGSSQPTATGYERNVNIWKGMPCQPCFKESPAVSSQPLDRCHNPEEQDYENPKHECMATITVDEVYEKVLEVWETTS